MGAEEGRIEPGLAPPPTPVNDPLDWLAVPQGRQIIWLAPKTGMGVRTILDLPRRIYFQDEVYIPGHGPEHRNLKIHAIHNKIKVIRENQNILFTIFR